MNTDKTAMQELIDFGWKSLDSTPLTMIRFAEKLMEKQNKQIKTAYTQGVLDGCTIHERAKAGLKTEPDHYFNETFKNK